MKQPAAPTTITADGKCLSCPPADTETLELHIDGNGMAGGRDSATLTGTPGAHLPESIHYRLTAFEPQQDGTCVARYVRVNADAG